MNTCKKTIIYDLWETNENFTYVYINIEYIYIIYIYTCQYIDTKKIYVALKSDCRIWQMLLLHYSQYLTRSG